MGSDAGAGSVEAAHEIWIEPAEGLVPGGPAGNARGGGVGATAVTVIDSDAWLLALALFAASIASTV